MKQELIPLLVSSPPTPSDLHCCISGPPNGPLICRESDHFKIFLRTRPAIENAANHLKSAVYSSLIKPLGVGSDNGYESSQCRTGRWAETRLLDGEETLIDIGLREEREREGEGEEMAYREESELQLSHVSRGARKLTQMIESLSNGPNLNGQSKYVAKDLLRGARDLQESLAVLRRLQASAESAGRRRSSRVEPRYEGESDADVLGYEAMDSRRFAVSGHREKFQEPRLSLDGNSRNCEEQPRLSLDGNSRNYEELRKVVRDNIRRPNLSSASFDEQKSSSSRSLSFGGSGRFSDSSYEHRVAKDYISAAEQPKKAKSTSLIAKLMGLEEVPPEKSHCIVKEEETKKVNLTRPPQFIMKEEEKRSVSPARPGFDLVMPKSMKLPFIEQMHEPRQKSLQEIIDTMQFKGLLKNDQAKAERNDPMRYYDVPQSKQLGRNGPKDEKAPPIVIMRPLHSPYRERGEAQKDLLLGKIAVKEKIPSRKIIQEKEVTDHELVLPKTLRRTEGKKVEKTRVEPFQKDNGVVSGVQKQHKKDGIGLCKKTNVVQKPPLHRKTEEAKSVRAPISQAKLASARESKHDERSSAEKTGVSRQRGTQHVNNARRQVLPAPQNSISNSKEKKTPVVKPARKSTPANPINNTKKLRDGKASDPIPTIHDVPPTSPSHVDYLAQELSIRDHTNDDHRVFDEAIPKTENQESIDANTLVLVDKVVDLIIPDSERFETNYAIVVDKVIDQIIQDSGGKKSEPTEEVVLPDIRITVRRTDGIEEDMKWLLVSSQSFLSFAQEVFRVDAQQPKFYQRKGFEEVVTRNAKLFEDCGMELLACTSRQRELLIHPLMQAHGHVQTLYASLDQLVEEISDGIGRLIGYIVVGDDVTPEDSLYIRLKRDLGCKEMSINTTWDLGWRSRSCIEESDQVVGEVEEHILAFLLEEMVMDFN